VVYLEEYMFYSR